ncbi:MAG TPA: HAD family hydrolase [Chthonomonadales bacterium]|nr:HAD family hydrolase [Chthonomonadales bacterium]
MIDRRHLKALLFDVDGTLYRQKPLRRAMALRLIRHYLLQPMCLLRTARILRAYREAQEDLRKGSRSEGSIANAQLQMAAERTGIGVEAVANCVNRWMEQEPLALLPRFRQPGLTELLHAACEKRLRLGVVSDYPAMEKLRALGIARYVEVVVTAQEPEVNAFKPDPTGLKVALQRLRVAPQEVLYVGDRPEVDAVAACSVGIPCVILTNEHTGGNNTGWDRITSFNELSRVLFYEPK